MQHSDNPLKHFIPIHEPSLPKKFVLSDTQDCRRSVREARDDVPNGPVVFATLTAVSASRR